MLYSNLKRPCIVFLLLVWCTTAFAQQKNKTTISGYVKQSANGESIIGASVFLKENGVGVATNNYGFYSLSVTPGNYTVVFQYLGFKSVERKINVTTATTININLESDGKQIDEVVVSSAGIKKNVTSMEMGVNKLEMKSIQKMPALMGEVDIVRSIQLLPGISTVGEGSSGFNVRGGGVDQNLILLDESPVYNSSHLFGFFSVFDPDAVKDVKLIKGGIPAMYGGRLSSILDVRMKEGNVNNFSTSGGIGTVSTRLLAEAPIVKGKGSFVIAARRSYADLFLKLSSDENLNKNTAYFYDLSGKANYTINENNRLYLSGYFGKDKFGFNDRFGMDWGNGTGTLRWNHTFNPSLFVNFTGVYSNYDYSLGIPTGTNAFDWTSRIINQTLKGDFTYYISASNKLSFGANATFYRFKPGEAKKAEGNTSFNNIALATQNGREYAAYIDNEQKITDNLSAQYGLRLSAFDYVSGQDNFTVYEYEGINGQRKDPVNPKSYNKGDAIKTYINLEPRVSLRYILNDASSIKASYNRTTQYLHLISNTTAATPLDVWQPTTNNIKPELADQLALGYFRNFKNDMFEFSVEGFYKKMQNQIDYIDGAELFLNKNLESELLFGNARAYGLEFYLKKNTGKLNGWISYTLSKSERQIDGINNNEYYPSKYDKTHNLSIVGIYDMSKRWNFSAIFTYSTGVSTTFPNGRYEVDGIVVPHNTTNTRNNYRIPSYNRLDLSATLYTRHKPGSKFSSNWVFSIYNIYFHKNPYTIYFQPNEDNPQVTEAKRLAIIGSAIPSVTYNFNFR
ncbi:TonB-dependent receptor [Solitalea canadensis]|uniref:Outer membrane receptor protein n=1 Tax=Solitalea canadensis (strain ATCC 29591 / DSM 3403 / JCM 21819 / LMG 8368 / NBRC 15130 / NCIMB 12057 / USAM 9D) TaxID=929556 RepID=H8KN34_SOLCM|nr:TonB-dependent receptor [Solitalea canadensis]AFD09113.1 outer membrane receptor protein [Solitalea canadensis DSM 3403]